MTDRIAWVAFVAMMGVLIAVADMNWPSHMGPQNVLVDGLLSLLP